MPGTSAMTKHVRIDRRLLARIKAKAERLTGQAVSDREAIHIAMHTYTDEAQALLVKRMEAQVIALSIKGVSEACLALGIPKVVVALDAETGVLHLRRSDDPDLSYPIGKHDVDAIIQQSEAVGLASTPTETIN